MDTSKNYVSCFVFTTILCLSYSTQLMASSIGEIVTVDGKKYEISQFGSVQFKKDYYVRTSKGFITITKVKNIVRINASATRFSYLIILNNGNLETGRQGFLLYESISFTNPVSGEFKIAYTPVIKDREQKGLVFTTLNTFDNSKKVIEITHLSNIDSISLNY